MGRTAAYTQEQVFEAADKLAANGQEVTANALRDVLRRGSYSTFVKHIDAWRRARQASVVPVVFEMPEAVKAAFAQCWQAAASEAGKDIVTIREKADAEIQAIRHQLDEALAAIDQLEAEADADAARIEAAEAALATERTAVQQAAIEAAAREAGLKVTIDQMRQQIEALQAESIRDRKQIEELITKLGRAEGELEASRINIPTKRQPKADSVRHAVPNA